MDCSVTAGWVIGSQSDLYTTAVLDNIRENKVFVPGIWLYEVANLLLSAERREAISREDSTAFYHFLKGLSVEIVHKNDEEWSELLLWMAKSHELSSYDTAYLYLAMDRGYPLATRDKKMQAAAESAGVTLFRP
ncbi:MAG: type II toxin-antitoxin system VapC family toxin [Deltaproteobacteria bacterium]|nr:type II toxin-antitoxin system VapC family toxin [Deltaproteobacteria bacterium]